MQLILKQLENYRLLQAFSAGGRREGVVETLARANEN